MRQTSTAPAVMWYAVVNIDDQVLAVFGSALGDEARAKRDELRAQFPFTGFEVKTTTGTRPRVGSKL